MKFCNQDISKTIKARSFKLGQLITRMISRLPGENKKKHKKKTQKKHFFLVNALCKFGHRKLKISKTVTDKISKLGQLIEDIK